MLPEKTSIVKTLVEKAEEIPATRARRDGRKKHVLMQSLQEDNKPSFAAYGYYDATVLLGKLGSDLIHDVGNRISSTAIEKRSLQSQQRRFLVPRRSRKVLRFVPVQVQFQPLTVCGLFRRWEM